MESPWDFGNAREDRIHRIHPYPARFPAFITTKALKYAEEEGIQVQRVADVFCGCGTTAVEAKRNGKDFWGCDINPLAILIAQVKTHCYRNKDLERNCNAIRKDFHNYEVTAADHLRIGERIRYWFNDENINDLIRLDRAIRQKTHPYSSHRKFFQCAFSAILKPTSCWLTKSIKAQCDPNKVPRDVLEAFEDQFELMCRANKENIFPRSSATTRIRKRNFLGRGFSRDKADLIVTSPPYVTSYDYAEIHQLSTLWLGYMTDYRLLRKHMLGNRYNVRAPHARIIRQLGDTAWRTYQDMQTEDPSRAASIARYFVDLDKAIRRCWDVLDKTGIAVFVIGNTQYKGVKIENAEHVRTSMERVGFKKVCAISRKVSAKTMTPFRDERGRFTRDCSQRQVYAKEFVIIGKKS